MSTTIRISDEAYERLSVRAALARRTITAVVDEWLEVPVAVTSSSVPSTSSGTATGEGVAPGVSSPGLVGAVERESPEDKTEPVSPEPSCARCGHLERKHTPRCYEARCQCRGFLARPQ